MNVQSVVETTNLIAPILLLATTTKKARFIDQLKVELNFINAEI